MNSRIGLAAFAFISLFVLPGIAFAQASRPPTLDSLLDGEATAPTQTSEPDTQTPRQPLPDKAAIDEAVDLIRQAYEDDLKATKTHSEQVVTKLLSAADQTEDSARKYALLIIAEEIAVGSQETTLAITVFDKRASLFGLDALSSRLQLLRTLLKQGASVDRSFFNYIVRVAEQALDADRYEQADEAAELARAAAKAIDKSEKAKAAEAKRKRQQIPEPVADTLIAEAAQLEKNVGEQKKQSADYLAAKEKLSATPDDAEAAEVVGTHLCFVRNDWSAGLQILAKAKSEELKALAVRELAVMQSAEPDPQSLFKLTGDWWKLAETKDPTRQESHNAAMRSHAAGIYLKILSGLSDPIDITLAKKRIASAQSASGETAGDKNDSKSVGKRKKAVNLLALVDPARDTVSGRWTMTPAGVVSDGAKPAKLKITYDVPEEYDFVIDFTHLENAGNVAQICSRKDCAFVWALGHYSEGKYSGFELVGGRGSNDNRSTVIKPGLLRAGQRYVSVVRVRKEGLAAFLNNTEISSLQTDYSDLSIKDGWAVPDGSLGIATWRSPTVFHRIELVPVSK